MKPNGLEVVDLKDIIVLRHLSDGELDDIKAVHVYGRDRSLFDGLSALYVTKKDEVYLAGFDSLVGNCCTKKGPHRHHKSVVVHSNKVEALSGHGVRKIVVGDEFGAALTAGNDLYMWGSDVEPSTASRVPAGVSRLAVEGHYDGHMCPKCSQKCRKSGFYDFLSVCCVINGTSLHNRVSIVPAPTDWKGYPHIILGYAATDAAPQIPNLFCARCRRYHQCNTVKVSNFFLLYCSESPQPRPLIDGYLIPPQTNRAPHKVTFDGSTQITDIAAGKNFLLLHASSELIIWGDLGGVRYNNRVSNPDIFPVARLSCGSSHIAVVSDKGELYTCGMGDKGQLGYDWTSEMGHMCLKKVVLEGPAVDVGCGQNSTVCHLLNGTYVAYGDFAKIISGGTWSMELLETAVICMPTAASHVEIVESPMKYLSQPYRKRSAILTGDHSDTFIHLHGLKVESSEGSLEQLDKCRQTDLNHLKTGSPNKTDKCSSMMQGPDLALLYGQQPLSDLTVKLSDGGFPVHRSVLFAASAHFRQFFSESKNGHGGVLDMSSYNAEAYRGLLKYFYGIPVGRLSSSDLFDLYVLALRYKEDWISNDVLFKLTRSIDSNNVILLLDKAKTVSATELVKACKTFMNDPEFKRSLWDSLSQDEDIFENIVRLSISNKS